MTNLDLATFTEDLMESVCKSQILHKEFCTSNDGFIANLYLRDYRLP